MASISNDHKQFWKFVKPFLEYEWTSLIGGMLNVQLREDTGVVWLASSSDPDNWSSFALQTTRHSRTLLLINSDGSQWQFEPRESNLTTGSVSYTHLTLPTKA